MGNSQGNTHLNMDHANISGTNKMNNKKTRKDSHVGIIIVGILGLIVIVAIVVAIVYLKNKSDDNKPSTTSHISMPTNQPDSSFFSSASLLSSTTIPSVTSDASPHVLAAAATPTIDNLPSSFITIGTTTPTPTPTPTPALLPISQPPPAPQPLTTAPAYLTPGASCTADSQCSPNICYTQPNTATYCCGPSITGCPGWPCTDPEHRDCKDPFTCNFQASTCG